MSLRIGNGVSSFYDSSSRIERARQAQEIETQKSSQQSAATSQNTSYDRERNDGSPIQRTQVSSENSYQRTMLSDPSYAFDRMAGKLMDKLPQIFADMKAVPDFGTEISEPAAQAASPSRVVIAEGSVADHAADSPQQLEDISLGL